ncbi:hypothetical protein ABTX81_30280 [Kitasatospora sp. NPDC097605]|uniref:hypothetical protein n=1 Tax=Kitasatospora sp. NPDC097605 TaxID=3157226 RepID=UPI0033174001
MENTTARSLYLRPDVKRAATAKAKAEGIALVLKIRQGWDDFMAGRFTVTKPVRTEPGQPKVRSAQWEADAYWDELAAVCTTASTKSGFTVNPSVIADQYLAAWVGLELVEPEQEPLVPHTLYLYGSLKVLAMEQAKLQGTTLTDKLREGFAAFVAGDLEITEVLGPLGPSDKKKPIPFRATDSDWDQLTAYCTAESAEVGFTVNPSVLADLILRTWLGLPTTSGDAG